MSSGKIPRCAPLSNRKSARRSSLRRGSLPARVHSCSPTACSTFCIAVTSPISPRPAPWGRRFWSRSTAMPRRSVSPRAATGSPRRSSARPRSAAGAEACIRSPSGTSARRPPCSRRSANLDPGSFSRAPLLRRAVLQLASRKALPQLVQSGGERFGDFAHGEVDLLHRGFAGGDPCGAHALVAQLDESRLRSLLGLEYAQRNGELELGILLHDEEILHAELFQLGGFPVGRLTAALRRHKHPVAREFLHAALGESWAQLERL